MPTSVAAVARPAPKPAARVPRATAPPPARASSSVSPAFSTALPAVRLNDGEPLNWRMRRRIEKSFGAGLGAVRVHRSHRAATAADQLGAKAFAFGPNIVLSSHARPDDLGLMAHEAAHTIQQGSAPVPQFFTLSPSSGDAHEREAQQASAAVLSGRHFRVTGRTPTPRVQRLGVRDALDYFANAANNIPGFSMLTYVIRFNPISMREVPRNATNLFRAIIGFLPGGNLIFEALQRHGILERVGAWLQEQLATLGMGVRSFREALDEFLGSLGWRDIFNLRGVWQRAQRIFTGPIDRLIGFVRGLVGGILGFIRNAILRPVARLAQGTRGYDLLRLVLGHDPITGDPYPRTAENMIGGFMRLIGEEEKWRHLQQSRAIPRAWAWFQQQMGTLMGFVREIPQLFSRLWQGLQISDLLDIGGAFNRARGIFGGFVERFFSWAGNAALQIMLFIFEALAPRAMPVLRRAASVLGTIVREPVRFVGNLVRAGLRGFEQFRANIRRHLLNGLVGWLTGALTNAGLQLPTRWDARGILSLALQILGLTWQNIRVKLVRVMGETAVRALETTFELVVTLVREGPAAAWQRILEHLGNLRDMVFDQIRTWVRNTIVGQAVVRILSMLNPAGAVIAAIRAIYDTIIFFRDRLQQISQVAESFFNSIAEIAAGNIGAAATRVEQTMGRLVPVVISFLAQLIGLGGISGTIRDIIARLRAPIDRALDRVVDWIVAQARRLGSRLLGGDPNAPAAQRVERALTEAVAAVNRFSGQAVGAVVLRPLLASIRVRHRLRTLDVVASGDVWSIDAAASPGVRRRTSARVGPTTLRTRVAYTPGASTAKSTEVYAFPLTHLPGTSPNAQGSRANRESDSFPRAWSLVANESRPRKPWRRMHQLSAELHGPGTIEANIVPAVERINSRMRSRPEDWGKKEIIRKPSKVGWYRVRTTFNNSSPHHEFPSSITVAGGFCTINPNDPTQATPGPVESRARLSAPSLELPNVPGAPRGPTSIQRSAWRDLYPAYREADMTQTLAQWLAGKVFTSKKAVTDAMRASGNPQISSKVSVINALMTGNPPRIVR